jgi:hypothetical protein
VERVTAQQADEDGLISTATLLSDYRDRTARDRSGERLGKGKREEIRKWANANGFEQAATGMIKQEVLEAYYAAHEKRGAHGD